MLSNQILESARSLIGERLRLIREQRGITASELAGRVKCSQSTISRIESGKFFPAMNLLLSILNELDCYLFFAEKDADDGIDA